MIARIRPATTLPASLILAPRELKQYRRFQAQTTTLPPKCQGHLPTASEYADFQRWLTKRDSGYLSDTPLADIAYYVDRTSEKKEEKGKASICGHDLHPIQKGKYERCPVCTVEMHITYMKTLTVALEDAGGLAKQRWEAADRDCPALQAWYAGKLAFVKDIYWLESLAEDEEEYNQHQQHLYSTQVTTDFKTATQALQLYWDSMGINPTMMRSPHRKTTCSVTFCPETSFEQGRDQHYFWRKSPRYEAGGKYASSSDDDEQNVEDEECVEYGNEEERPVAMITNAAVTHEQDLVENEWSDEEASDLEDEDADNEKDEEDDDEDDEEVDVGYVVFEYEEVVVQGAEFVVFED